ncbi:hypothetical protein LINPERPRIM_LOCUS20508 [Linum perenne]
MVIRDRGGQLLHFRSSCWNGCWSSTKAECKALLEGLSWTEELGIDRVQFQSDAKQVVDSINKRVQLRTELGDLTRRCLAILARNPGFKVSFIGQDHKLLPMSLLGTLLFCPYLV